MYVRLRKKPEAGRKEKMERESSVYKEYLQILERELVPAFGCTEPIAIAYGTALAADILGKMPEKIRVEASGNIIKNVKSVIVPGTGGMKGIQTAVAAGVVAGHPERKLELLEELTREDQLAIRDYLKKAEIQIQKAGGCRTFDLTVTVWSGVREAKVQIADSHTNVVHIEKNGRVLREEEETAHENGAREERPALSIEGILDFAMTSDIRDVEELLDRQIRYNMAIAEEGMKHDYGANIGKVLLASYGDDIKIRARAKAAAGSDARMNGCELPVVINSGSGNQGITVSVPVIEYAAELGAGREKLYRALLISNLTAIHLKKGIGRLSAYCGAVSAGTGAGAGIAYLMGGGYEEIVHTIVNTLANVSGIVCDGAKASCAAKIASAVDAGILGFYMYRNGQEFVDGDGIVKKGVESTIANIARLGRDGMRETDREIIDMMIG